MFSGGYQSDNILNLPQIYQRGTGLYSILVLPELGNVVTGAYSAIIQGNNNTASGKYSLAIGQGTEAALYGEFAKASGALFTVRGSAQCSTINLRGVIYYGETKPLSLDGDLDGAHYWTLPLNSIHIFSAYVVIVCNTGSLEGECWTGIFDGAVKNFGGTTSWVSSGPTLREIRGDDEFTPGINLFTVDNKVMIEVTGISEQVLFAGVTVQITQTKFNLAVPGT